MGKKTKKTNTHSHTGFSTSPTIKAHLQMICSQSEEETGLQTQTNMQDR